MPPVDDELLLLLSSLLLKVNVGCPQVKDELLAVLSESRWSGPNLRLLVAISSLNQGTYI